MRKIFVAFGVLGWAAACSSDNSSATDGGLDSATDSAADVLSVTDASDAQVHVTFCNLPGSIQFTTNGKVTVPSGDSGAAHDLSYLTIPTGFCAHYFGNVGNAQRLKFAPGGELFVASPTTLSTYGGQNGTSSIVILADDDHDGFADGNVTFLSGIASTYGLLFHNGFVYYQNNTHIESRPYASGDRTPTNPEVSVVDITNYESTLHWEKPIDVADDGTIYLGNGGDQGESCDGLPHPVHGGIVSFADGGTEIAQGMRWPAAVRCPAGHDLCFALEQARDYSDSAGGRDKLVPIHAGDDWGFPCCATHGAPYGGITPTDCSGTATEPVSFSIGENPNGLDFETGTWPAPWTGRAFVALVGAAGTGIGARIVSVPIAANGDAVTSSDLGDAETGGMMDFATGWDVGKLLHGVPFDVAFSSDHRLFVANAQNGDIFWIGPL